MHVFKAFDSLENCHQFHGAVSSPRLAWCQRRPLVTRFRAAQTGEKEQQELSGEGEMPKEVDIELFETAGTPEDRSAWEPFSGGPNSLQTLLSALDFSEPTSFDGEDKTEYDPLRDGPLRYLGYANELGEAFAAWIFAGGVSLTYAIAIGYVLFDTVDKYQRTLADAQQKLSSRPVPADVNLDSLIGTIGLERGVDTLAWQLIASVAAPGYTIHTVVALTSGALEAAEAQPPVAAALAHAAAALGAPPGVFLQTFNKSVPTAVGLLAIPFIVHPIDGAVHAVLNATLRPAMRRYICTQAGGSEAGLAICKDLRRQGPQH